MNLLDRRPIVIALAGPNGAGKSSFHRMRLAKTGLPFVNADDLAREHGIDPYAAAAMAEVLRQEHVRAGESFVFETVLSDPKGEKVKFLSFAAGAGFTVLLCFIGLSSAHLSAQRVAMRVSRGGHDVPAAKLKARYRRTLANLRAAIRALPNVWVFDNSDLARPYQEVAKFEKGRVVSKAARIPAWAKSIF